MIKKWLTATVAATLLLGSVSSSAFAFNDLHNVEHADKIIQLRNRGIINGITKDVFAPRQKMTAAQAIPLIVRSMKLEIPEGVKLKGASDIFEHVTDDDWFALDFVVASANGLEIDAGVKPNEHTTREQFMKWLISAVNTKGEYALTSIFIAIEDEDDVSEGYMHFIQTALITGIAKLNDEQKFRPKDPIIRGEAAVMVFNAVDFIEQMKPIEKPSVDDPIQTGEVTAIAAPISDEVQKITLSWGEQPHPGYSIEITGIDFPKAGSAVIRYALRYPDPDKFYPMVIVTPTASTYVDASITEIQYELEGSLRKIKLPMIPRAAQ